MNRFEYTDPSLADNESFVLRERNVRLYDGEQKTSFEGGEIILTTHRIIWGNQGAFHMGQIILSLPLRLVLSVQEERQGAFSFSRSKKIIMHLREPSPDRNEGPQVYSTYDCVKLSFREGYGATDIVSIISYHIEQRKWESSDVQPTTSSKSLPSIKLRTGIVGIERSLEEKQKATDKSISVAFQDLDKLMTMAKDMVKLSSVISTKIREKQGDITEDETVRFKSYLLSLGIDDPVTRDGHKSDNHYYASLAKQVSDILSETISDVGGMMALTDVYCRVNRARGFELLSPEDLLNACKVMDSLGLPLKLYQFDSGVKVLQLQTLDSETVSLATAELLEEKGSVTAEELAQLLNVSILLAKERLVTTENAGRCCRDDSIEGLRFFPNLFLTKEE